MKHSLILLLFIVGLFSCTEEVSITPEDRGQAYFPVKVGNYWIYDVSETKVLNNQYDSTRYQVRELIDTVFKNQLNESTYRVLRSRRTNEMQAWGNDSLYTINLSPTNVQIARDNKRIISLVFPVKEGKGWNANAFNNLEETEFYYEDVNQPIVTQGKSYPKTLKIIQGNTDVSLLEDSWEIYALETGLIYKKMQVYEYSYNQNNGEVDKSFITTGTKRIYKLNVFYTPE